MSENCIAGHIFMENMSLLENIQGGIIYSDDKPPFHLRYATEGMARLSGYSVSELITMKQMDLVHPDDIESLVDDVTRQFMAGDTFEVEYRLLRKDGSFIYVLDRAKSVVHPDGKIYIHCLLTDITELKMMEQAVRLSEEKCRIAVQQSGNVIFEYDKMSNILKFSDNYPQVFGTDTPCGTPHDLVESQWIAGKNAQQFMEMLNASLERQTVFAMEFLITSEEQSIWCSMHMMSVLNSLGEVYAVVGCLQNIDNQKRELEVLTELSQKDQLTGIYNRTTIEKMVNDYLQNDNNTIKKALIIMDIDNFKSVNDKNGHAYGDDVLIAVSREVACILPENALFGRLGGDEFLIFLWNIPDKQYLHSLSQGIVDRIRAAFLEWTHPITATLGAAHYAGDGMFLKLYKDADKALYSAKCQGRNCYRIVEQTDCN